MELLNLYSVDWDNYKAMRDRGHTHADCVRAGTGTEDLRVQYEQHLENQMDADQGPEPDDFEWQICHKYAPLFFNRKK